MPRPVARRDDTQAALREGGWVSLPVHTRREGRVRREDLENGPHVYFKGRLFIISVCASGSSMCEEMAKQRSAKHETQQNREHSLKIIILNNNKRQPNAQFLLRCFAYSRFLPFAFCILNTCEGARDELRIPCNNATHTRAMLQRREKGAWYAKLQIPQRRVLYRRTYTSNLIDLSKLDPEILESLITVCPALALDCIESSKLSRGYSRSGYRSRMYSKFIHCIRRYTSIPHFAHWCHLQGIERLRMRVSHK